MSSITIRNLDPAVKERLRICAAEHGNSMKAEARRILRAALGEARPHERNLYERIWVRFVPLGGGNVSFCAWHQHPSVMAGLRRP